MKHYLFLDLETTGFEAGRDEIIELAFIVTDTNGTELARSTAVVQCEVDIPPIVTQITGITQAEMNADGIPWSSAFEPLKPWLENTVMVGHNIDFDRRFLEAKGVDLSQCPRIDTHELARIALVESGSYSLEALAAKYGFGHENAHRALSDVEANRDLYFFLVERIQALPAAYQDVIAPLWDKTTWYARTLFTGPSGPQGEAFPPRTTPEPLPEVTAELSPKTTEALMGQSTGDCLLVRQTESTHAASWATSVARTLADHGAKVLIISPKLRFFDAIPPFPTPEVIFSLDRFWSWVNAQDTLNDSETAFALQCLARHLAGYRGKNHFHLFFEQYRWWNNVCLHPEDTEAYEPLAQEKTALPILSITPRAYWQWRHLFSGRTLIIDEGETFVRELLFAPAKTLSLEPLLRDDTTEAAAMFFTADVCREVLEPHTGRAIGPFPVRAQLPPQNFQPYMQRFEGLTHPTIDALRTLLDNTEQTLWAEYNPRKGILKFGGWTQHDFYGMRSDLSHHKSLVLHRHASETNAFWRAWLGVTPTMLKVDSLTHPITLVREKKMPSVKSAEFADETITRITRVLGAQDTPAQCVIANFSSGETLMKVGPHLEAATKEHHYKVIGERLNGGNGKVIGLTQKAHANHENVVLLTQKMTRPELATMGVREVLVQKFPFQGPHPLLEHIEAQMRKKGESFWSLWTVPMTAATLNQRTYVGPELETVYLLDPRHHARWAPEMLRSAFPDANIV